MIFIPLFGLWSFREPMVFHQTSFSKPFSPSFGGLKREVRFVGQNINGCLRIGLWSLRTSAVYLWVSLLIFYLYKATDHPYHQIFGLSSSSNKLPFFWIYISSYYTSVAIVCVWFIDILLHLCTVAGKKKKFAGQYLCAQGCKVPRWLGFLQPSFWEAVKQYPQHAQ